jgi:hypothetical protein
MPWTVILLTVLMLGACGGGPRLVDRDLQRGTALPPPELAQPVASGR